MNKKVFKAKYIISSSSKIYKNAYILIDNNKIIEITNNFKEEFNKYEFYDYSKHVIMPGLIDSHVHSYQIGNRGKNVKKSLIDWLSTHILPWESELTPEKAKLSSLISYTEMIESGTTTFSDFTSVNHTEKAFEVAKDLGLRAFIGKTMNINVPQNLKQTTSKAIEESINLIKNGIRKKMED